MLKELATVQLSCSSGPAFWLELAPNVLFSSQDAIAAAMTALEVKTRAWPAAPDTLTKAQLDVLEAKSHTLLAAFRKSARATIRAEVRVMPGNNEATVLPRFYDSAALHVSSEDNLRMRCVETKQAKRIRAPRLRHEANIPNEFIAYVRAVVRKLISKGALRNIPSQKSAPPEYACTHTTTHARTQARTHARTDARTHRCTHAQMCAQMHAYIQVLEAYFEVACEQPVGFPCVKGSSAQFCKCVLHLRAARRDEAWRPHR